MKKALTIGMVAALTAGGAMAQNSASTGSQGGFNSSDVKISAEAALLSSYVWRGVVYNNDIVFQPQLTIETYGVSFNIWGNYDLGGSSINGTSSDLSELDLSLAYTLPFNLDDVTFSVGVIGYNYPANGDMGSAMRPSSTTELFGKATLLTFKDYVIPSYTLFGDIDAANGTYMIFDIMVPYQVNDELALQGGASAGWGNTSYNDYYWGAPSNNNSVDKGFNDFNFYVNANYKILDNLTASANVTYTFLSGGSISDAAKMLYDNNQKIWGGINLIYDF